MERHEEATVPTHGYLVGEAVEVILFDDAPRRGEVVGVEQSHNPLLGRLHTVKFASGHTGSFTTRELQPATFDKDEGWARLEAARARAVWRQDAALMARRVGGVFALVLLALVAIWLLGEASVWYWGDD